MRAKREINMGIIREMIDSYCVLRQLERILSEYAACDIQNKQPTCYTHIKLPDGSESVIGCLLEKFLEYREKAKLFDNLKNTKNDSC